MEPRRLMDARHQLAQVPLPHQFDPQALGSLGLVRPGPEGLLKVRRLLTELTLHRAGPAVGLPVGRHETLRRTRSRP